MKRATLSASSLVEMGAVVRPLDAKPTYIRLHTARFFLT